MLGGAHSLSGRLEEENKRVLVMSGFKPHIIQLLAWCPDGSVGIATRYVLDGPGIESRWGARFSAPVQTGPGAYPASRTMGTGYLPGLKRPGRGADHPSTHNLAPRLKEE